MNQHVSTPNYSKAVIFDLDGVLTDTAHYHFLAWQKIAEQVGVHFDEQSNEALKGIDRMTSLQMILAQSEHSFSDHEVAQLAAQKNQHYLSLIAQMQPSDVFAGVVDLLAELRAAGFALGVASISKNAQFVLQRLALAEHFDFVADAAKIAKPKPHPEIFLTVAAALGVPPAQCVGIEDAKAGVESIQSAGMPAIGIGSTEILGAANIVVPHTSDVTLAHILSLLT